MAHKRWVHIGSNVGRANTCSAKVSDAEAHRTTWNAFTCLCASCANGHPCIIIVGGESAEFKCTTKLPSKVYNWFRRTDSNGYVLQNVERLQIRFGFPSDSIGGWHCWWCILRAMPKHNAVQWAEHHQHGTSFDCRVRIFEFEVFLVWCMQLNHGPPLNEQHGSLALCEGRMQICSDIYVLSLLVRAGWPMRATLKLESSDSELCRQTDIEQCASTNGEHESV